MKKYIVFPMMLAAVVLTSCSSKEEKKEKAEELPTVKVQTVEARDVDQIGTYTASAEPEIINNITSNQPNRIKQILVDEGQRVAAGQKVVVMDDVNTFSYETQVDNAKANLANVQQNYNRALELYKIGGGTKQNLDAMELQLTNAKNAVAQAERALRNVRENTVLTSPISGVVTARNYDPGDMASGMPILTVARIQPVKLVINVTESELPKIRNGMKADVRFDTYGDEAFQGTVTTIMPTVDPGSRTFGVEITLPNSDSRILPGMFGRASINLGTANRVVIPDKAVVKQQGSGNHFVYVLQPDGTLALTQVQLGQRMGDEYELISGVESGSQVVVSALTKLNNGIKVQVAK